MKQVLVLALLWFAACGKDAPAPVAGLTVIFRTDARWKQEEAQKEMESALARFPELDLVYAHNDPMAYGAYLACQQAGRKGVRFVGIDALRDEGVRYVQEGVLDATVEYPTGGAEGVDLALLLLHRVAIQKDIVLGTRVFTKANLAQGGDAVEAPGAKVVADLRAAHAARLAREAVPAGTTIGMSQCTLTEPWRVQMNRDVREQAERRGVRVDFKDAQDDTERQRQQIDELVAAKVAVLLVSPKESVALVPAVDRAMAAGIPVVVLDRKLGGPNYSVFLGGDNVAIGRAAGEQVKRLLGGRGRIVEIQGLMTSSPAEERHRGFVEALR